MSIENNSMAGFIGLLPPSQGGDTIATMAEIQHVGTTHRCIRPTFVQNAWVKQATERVVFVTRFRADQARGVRKSLTEMAVIGLVDGRTRQAQAFYATVAELVSDHGGEDAVSRAELELIRRAAGLAILAAQFEADILGGDKVNVERYVVAINAQRRVLTTLGLGRRARHVTPDPLAYAARSTE